MVRRGVIGINTTLLSILIGCLIFQRSWLAICLLLAVLSGMTYLWKERQKEYQNELSAVSDSLEKLLEKKEILYFEGRKKADSVLPESAEKLEGQISRLKAGKDRKKAEELWTQVLADCQDRYTDGRLLVQWLKKLNQTAGIEKELIWYGDIESFEKFREKGSACISQLFVGEEDAVPEGTSAAVKKALEFIREHYEAPISLQDAADAAEVNPAYLSYLFKQEMKIGFSNYVQELRIDCAKKLLSETNCKVKDVALRSGFGDYHYFSKIFKKFTGLSPAEYRKESGLS